MLGKVVDALEMGAVTPLQTMLILTHNFMKNFVLSRDF